MSGSKQKAAIGYAITYQFWPFKHVMICISRVNIAPAMGKCARDLNVFLGARQAQGNVRNHNNSLAKEALVRVVNLQRAAPLALIFDRENVLLAANRSLAIKELGHKCLSLGIGRMVLRDGIEAVLHRDDRWSFMKERGIDL